MADEGSGGNGIDLEKELSCSVCAGPLRQCTLRMQSDGSSRYVRMSYISL